MMNDLKNKKIEILFDYKVKRYVVWLIESKYFKSYLFTLTEKELKEWLKENKKEGKIDVFSK